MKHFGLIGMPVKEILSDIYHNRFLAHLGRSERYEKFELSLEQLGPFITDAKQSNMIGLSVTMPFKEEILSLLDEVEETAKKIGAVNTVKFIDGKSYGYNTDGKGAYQAIQYINSAPLRKKHAIIIGAGGTAKAIAWELSKMGMEITIVNRSFEKAITLAKNLKAHALPFSELIPAVNTKCDLLVQTTPVGMFDESSIIPANKIPSHITILDVLAAPKNEWLSQLSEKGCLTISGRLMWIFQAIEQYKIWLPCHFNQIPVNDLLQKLSLSIVEESEK